MANADYFFDTTNQAFIQSQAQPAILNPPTWYYGEVKPLRVRFYERASAQTVTGLTATGLAVQMAIGGLTPAVVVDTSATATGPSDNWFSFILPLNVAAVATALGTAEQVTRTLEFQLTSAGGQPIKFQTKINIRQRLITTTLSDPVPPETALGSNEARAIFVPRNGSDASYPCSNFIMLDSEDETKLYNITIQGGQLHADPLQ